MKLAACGGLPRSPLTGTWFRALDPRHLPTALSTTHTRCAPSRYNAGPLLSPSQQFETFYLAADSFTAMYEYRAVFADNRGNIVSNPNTSVAVLNVQVTLHEVFDLTDVGSAQVPLDTTAQELTGDWRGYQVRSPLTSIPGPVGMAPTQELGLAISGTGIEGFQTISATVPACRVLVILPRNFRTGSTVIFRDSTGRVLHRVP